MNIQTLLLLVGLLLPQLSLADGPPKQNNFPDGVSSQSLGADLWREVRQRDLQSSGVSQVKGVDSGILINAHGDQWARFRTSKLTTYGSIALAAMFGLVFLFYVIRGKIGIEGGFSGNMVQRFTDYQRIAHWTLAIVFLFLAITGLILLLGRPLLIPLFGKGVFSILASASKEGHNLFGPLFLVSLLMMLFSYVSRNIYEKGDLTWLLRLGGSIGDGHVSTGYFNMGEKIWYWIVILIGLVVALSGLILVSPNFGQGRVIMELSHITHTIGALALIVFSVAHIYLGWIGSEGAMEGMKTGYVDASWADAHHDRWGKECRDQGLVISAEEYARLQGKNPAVEVATEQGK